jgi:hypothetical protein
VELRRKVGGELVHHVERRLGGEEASLVPHPGNDHLY